MYICIHTYIHKFLYICTQAKYIITITLTFLINISQYILYYSKAVNKNEAEITDNS